MTPGAYEDGRGWEDSFYGMVWKKPLPVPGLGRLLAEVRLDNWASWTLTVEWLTPNGRYLLAREVHQGDTAAKTSGDEAMPALAAALALGWRPGGLREGRPLGDRKA